MAYFSQDQKKEKTPAIKAILKKYGLKGSLSVRHYSTLVLTIRSGKVDFVESFNRLGQSNSWKSSVAFQPVTDGYIQVNPYWFHEHFDGKAKDCLAELLNAMNVGNHNNSRPEIDYFDIGWYVDINIGQWNKPYICTKEKEVQ